MRNQLVLLREDCAIDPKDIVAVLHDKTEGVDMYHNKKTYHNVTFLIKSNSTPITLSCETQEEKIELFNKIIELQGETRYEE